MANLIVRNISDEVAQALKVHANRLGMSAEAAHRQILEQVLIRPKKKSFLEVLREMPDVGKDSDFARVQDDTALEVFS
ncbi:DNA-binding protein [Candidatus Thiothrix sp. Deng01]|uniref:DNA-binding protein n=1 Tax=Candidatus Thiothrix phosphatis TaxID=3112415 RepID=A0ABU6CRQ0_9GAMM|nr:DNA-binding protein [Candidatus Thiothrix sp. Deng01]MEB4589469.1 DNA-binding protein [Candidatus Thiothrix sp. Deng01]